MLARCSQEEELHTLRRARNESRQPCSRTRSFEAEVRPTRQQSNRGPVARVQIATRFCMQFVHRMELEL